MSKSVCYLGVASVKGSESIPNNKGLFSLLVLIFQVVCKFYYVNSGGCRITTEKGFGSSE